MKVFDLRCENDHPFEGWFTSEADFETQSEKKLIECPLCSSRDVRRLPSAARLNLGAQPPNSQEAMLPTPQQIHAALLKMAREIAAQTEDVGERFAEEARRIHYKEAPQRGIRGVTTPQEAAELREEGIDVIPFPFAALLREPLH
ncbi:MAG: DUF1178 family protein [Sutterellaceae bacterium]|nr:DUF1178 family protein [Burkholderiaceae bacterium]MDW8429795.1 DUF1178 family protein [Sutterellaceae bacterium]